MQPIIEIKKLNKSYTSGSGELVVFNDLDLTIARGQFISITGKSGSGKSTLLYQMGLLDVPNSGEITIDGVRISQLSNNGRTQFRLNKLGYIFQDYALVPDLSAIDNVILPLLMQGVGKRDALLKAEEALHKVGLSDKMHNLPNQLSGGQQQRISIARAIVHGPDIVFADEPTANLDTEMSRIVLDTFISLNNLGQTIVMVTHEKEYAEMADRMITLSDGKIISDIIKTTANTLLPIVKPA